MSIVVETSGHSVRDCLAAARRHLGLQLRDSRELIRSGGEDGLYRCTLDGGTVVECTVIRRARVMVHDTRQA